MAETTPECQLKQNEVKFGDLYIHSGIMRALIGYCTDSSEITENVHIIMQSSAQNLTMEEKCK